MSEAERQAEHEAKVGQAERAIRDDGRRFIDGKWIQKYCPTCKKRFADHRDCCMCADLSLEKAGIDLRTKLASQEATIKGMAAVIVKKDEALKEFQLQNNCEAKGCNDRARFSDYYKGRDWYWCKEHKDHKEGQLLQEDEASKALALDTTKAEEIVGEIEAGVWEEAAELYCKRECRHPEDPVEWHMNQIYRHGPGWPCRATKLREKAAHIRGKEEGR